MDEVVLNKQQIEGLDKLLNWYNSDHRFTRPFVIHGYAGTGKSTLTKQALNELEKAGLDPNQISLAAPTGKAAQVLSRKSGRLATTIHSLMYKPMTEYLEELKYELTNILEGLDPTEDYDSYPRVKAIHEEIKGLEVGDPRFSKQEVKKKGLIVVDEKSMVDTRIARDLLEQNIPLLLIGDPFQLPPIKSEASFQEFDEDVLLTQIMRQSGEGSGIVLAAQDIRLGNDPHNGEGFTLAPRGSVEKESFMAADVVICGKNIRRRNTNLWFRKNLEYPDLDIVAGEKIICTKNNKNTVTSSGLVGFFNGETFVVDKVLYQKGNDIYLDLVDCTGRLIRGVRVWKPYFFDEDDKKVPFGRLQFQFAYAITCHKSQGSEFESIIVDAEWPGSHYDRWLYTAVTRAVSNCVTTNYLG